MLSNFIPTQARHEAVAQRLAAATATTAHLSSGRQPPVPATPASSSRSAGPEKVTPVNRRLEARLARAARPSLAAHTPSGRAGRSPFSSGRQPSVAGGSKSMVAKFSLSCADEDKENSPALGKLVTPSRTPLAHKAAPPASIWTSPQQKLDSKPAQLSAYSRLVPMTGGVRFTPGMAPHALQFRLVAVPFWGSQADVPEPAANKEVPTTAGPITVAPLTAAAPTPAEPITRAPATAAPLPTTATPTPSTAETLTAAAGLTTALSGRRAVQGKPSLTVPTAAVLASRLSPPVASSTVTSSRQITTGRQSTISHAASINAGAAKQTWPRGSKRRTASAAATAASQIVTRSQAAAQKHVERMQTRSRQSKRL